MSVLEKQHKTLIILFLELLSLSPLFMILGNVVPPFPLKIHFITFGITFLLICLFLVQFQSKKWLIYLATFYFILQFFLSGFHFKEFVDFFFGPFVFLTLMDLLFNQRIAKVTLHKYQKRFFILLWVPMLIGFLQFIDFLPLTFWNADYINYSDVDGVKIARANGFLYHGSELSIIIFFVAAKQLIRQHKYFILTILFIALIAYSTYYKALSLTIIALILYYYTIINPLKWFRRFDWIFKKDKIIYTTIFTLTIVLAIVLLFKTQIQGIKELFPPQLLTGRGTIWNVYLQAISDFSFFEYLFGAGIGSEHLLFAQYARPELYFPLKADPNSDLSPDAHNALFSLFLNVGLIGIMFFIFIFKMCYNQLTKGIVKLKNRALYFVIFMLPFFTIGITIPYFKNAIFWIALGFTVHYWLIKKENKDEQAAKND